RDGALGDADVAIAAAADQQGAVAQRVATAQVRPVGVDVDQDGMAAGGRTGSPGNGPPGVNSTLVHTYRSGVALGWVRGRVGPWSGMSAEQAAPGPTAPGNRPPTEYLPRPGGRALRAARPAPWRAQDRAALSFARESSSQSSSGPIKDQAPATPPTTARTRPRPAAAGPVGGPAPSAGGTGRPTSPSPPAPPA